MNHGVRNSIASYLLHPILTRNKYIFSLQSYSLIEEDVSGMRQKENSVTLVSDVSVNKKLGHRKS